MQVILNDARDEDVYVNEEKHIWLKITKGGRPHNAEGDTLVSSPHNIHIAPMIILQHPNGEGDPPNQ